MSGAGLARMAVVLIAVLVPAVAARAGAPTERLRSSVDQVLHVVQSQPDTQARRAAIRKIATGLFDFEETAKRALGPHWRDRTPQERREFVQLFTDLVEAAYVGRIERYEGEKVAYVGEQVEGDEAVVRTNVISKQQEIPVNYRMRREPAGWRVYDVVIEGVSLIGNYRTQFNKIIQTSSYEELVERMRAKAFPAPEGGRRRRT